MLRKVIVREDEKRYQIAIYSALKMIDCLVLFATGCHYTTEFGTNYLINHM